MKVHVYDNQREYIIPDDIGLSKKLLSAFGVEDGDFVDIKIDGGKMIISRREARCKISAKEFDDAMEVAMDTMMGCSYSQFENALEVLFNELDIKVEEDC